MPIQKLLAILADSYVKTKKSKIDVKDRYNVKAKCSNEKLDAGYTKIHHRAGSHAEWNYEPLRKLRKRSDAERQRVPHYVEGLTCC
jgi:hypothetical protein